MNSNQSQAFEKFWLTIIGVVSVIVVLAVAFLILGPRPAGLEGKLDVSMLPAVNATLNSFTTLALIIAYLFIRRRNIPAHRRTMLTAFGLSAMFLVSYVLYHCFKSGPKQYTGDWGIIYFPVLISHILLAAIIVPLALITLYRGWTDQHPKHRRLARWTLPLWLYVSLSGVLIYWMLYG